jgi:hypothetical protein
MSLRALATQRLRHLRASGLQIATGGQWERATLVSFDGDHRGALARNAIGASAELAMEVLFGVVDRPDAFVGVRLRGWAVADSLRFVRETEQAIRSLPTPSPGRVMEAMTTRLEAPLFADPCDLIEAGAFNAWQAVGPLGVWARGERPLRASRFPAIVERASAHFQHCRRPVALELACSRPVQHWLGVRVSRASRRGDGGYGPEAIDPTRLSTWLARVTTVG